MAENGSLIPNTFQHPNLYVDRLAYYLTPQEQVVLQKAVREILGWKKKRIERRAYIALTIFVNGKFDDDGNRLCYGCGLGEGAVREALKGLHKYKILLKGIITQDGQLFTIQIDADAIDWEGLETRREEWDEANRKRTEEATRKRKEKEGVTSDVGGNVGREGVTPHDTTGVTSDDGEGVTSDVDKETQLETQLETKIPPEGAPPKQKRRTSKKKTSSVPAAVLVFRQNASRYPAKSWYSNVSLTVGEGEEDLQFWGKVVKGWVGCGWNPTNVQGMLEFYLRREIPTTNGKGRGGKSRDLRRDGSTWTKEELEKARARSLAMEPLDPATFFEEG